MFRQRKDRCFFQKFKARAFSGAPAQSLFSKKAPLFFLGGLLPVGGAHSSRGPFFREQNPSVQQEFTKDPSVDLEDVYSYETFPFYGGKRSWERVLFSGEGGEFLLWGRDRKNQTSSFPRNSLPSEIKTPYEYLTQEVRSRDSFFFSSCHRTNRLSSLLTREFGGGGHHRLAGTNPLAFSFGSSTAFSRR